MISQEQPRHWSPPSFKTRLFIYFVVFTLVLTLLFSSRGYRYRLYTTGEDWDVLIFTQSWPNTVCLKWEQQAPTNHTCRIPKEDGIWTIHGIWPTKLGTLGPTFCNSSYHFNISQLVPIQSNLTEYWADVEVPQPANSFWRHEWRKHGTCCSSLPSLDTELKYFETGLSWLQKYNMKGVLTSGGVLPDSNKSTDLTSLWLAVKTQLGFNPAFHCLMDKKTHQYYLQEIRICFDKKLQLTDCDGVKMQQGLWWSPIGNCPDDKPIFYPSTVPPPTRRPIPPPPDTSIISLYKIIQFTMWLTS